MHGKCGLFFTSYGGERQFLPSNFQRISLALFLLALLSGPLYLNSYHISILNLMGISVISATSLNLLTGFCGQISLGHGAFIGVGAYTTAFLAAKDWPFLLALPAGGLVSAVVGIIFGLPSMRLKGIYLAIATLAAQLILEYFFLHFTSFTGGANGTPVNSPSLFGLVLDQDWKMFYLIISMTILTVVLIGNIVRSKSGRAYVSIRDHHLSAEIVGVNLFRYKLQAFGASSFFAGIAGGVWGYFTMFINPEQFGISLSISNLAMIIIGGLGSIQGSIFGAVFLTLLPEFLNYSATLAGDWLPNISTHFQAMKQGVFGLVLILFLIFEPEGLAHRWRLVKAYWKLYPFAH